jgi:glycosyltransferase involved in cell wall biosynthesis
MSTKPVVSIGLPIYNGERYIRDTLPSVLNQTYAHLEIIISDNASTDATAAICQEYAARDSRVRYFRQPQTVSVITNFRRTCELATGEYFMWAAIDDVKPPTIVEETVAALSSHPDAVMAHGPIHVDVPGQPGTIEIAHDIDLGQSAAADRIRTFTRELRHNAMVFGLYRRDALARAAPYRQHVGHDYLMCLQMCLLGKIVRVASPLVVYLQRWGSIDTPMYTREAITLRDLLVYRGVRRRKCWVTLMLGCYYLLRAGGVPLRDKLQALTAHVGAFASRYRRELLDELPFLACTPLRWLMSPLMPSARKVKTSLVRRGLLRA